MLDERRPIQILRIRELDLLVLEPLAWIDEHTQAQRGLDLGIERAEPQRLFPLSSEAIFEWSFICVWTPIGDKKESIGPLLCQLRHRHAPKRKGLGSS